MAPDALKKKIDELWIDTADVKPENYNFGEGYTEKWDVAVDMTDEEMETEEFFPMMNYRYPLPDFKDKNLSDEYIKKALDRAGNVTLVKDLDTDEHYLALTGGGTDLSWDIVKGYVNLGYSPPAHFCRDLPRLSGDVLSLENKEAIYACRKSLDAQTLWNQRGMERLDDLERTMAENLRKWKAERKLRR